MKKILLALLMFAGLLTLAPSAEASWRSRRFYDYCGRPAFGYPSYRAAYYRAPAYGYYRPARAYYYRGYDYCAPRVRYYAPRPRFSFFFGF